MEKMYEGEYKSIVIPLEKPVHQYLYRRTRHYHLSNDLLQDVYERAWIWREKLVHSENPEAYLKAIAANEIVDYEYDKQHAESLVEKYGIYQFRNNNKQNFDAVVDTVQTNDDGNILTQAIRELPPQLRDIIVLHYVVGCTLQQTAIRQQLNYSTTLYKHQKALTLLRESLERKGIHASDVTLRCWLFMTFR